MPQVGVKLVDGRLPNERFPFGSSFGERNVVADWISYKRELDQLERRLLSGEKLGEFDLRCCMKALRLLLWLSSRAY